MSMKMQFQLAAFMKDLGIQFKNEDDLQDYMRVVGEHLAPYRLATLTDHTMGDIMSIVKQVTMGFHAAGRFATQGELQISKLNKNPKVYIDWVGTTSENAQRMPQVVPHELFQVVYHGILRYFQMQFDVGGWEVVNDTKTSIVHITLPTEKWEIGVTFNRKVENSVH